MAFLLMGSRLGSARLCSLDQSHGQLKPPTQAEFLAPHLAIIVLVIEARKMKDAVQRQNFDFLGQGMA